MKRAPMPYIYAQRMGKDNGHPEKIKLEDDMEALKASLTVHLNFPPSTPVLSLYDKEGTMLTSYDDIKAGMLIYASSYPKTAKTDSTLLQPDSEEFAFSDKASSRKSHKSGMGNDDEEQAQTKGSFEKFLHNFKDSALNREVHQDSLMFEGLQEVVGDVPSHSSSLDQYSKGVIKNALFSSYPSKKSTINIRTVLIGPQKSGKSTMLKLCAQNLISALTTSGQIKSTFVYVFDFLESQTAIKSPLHFYQLLITSLIDQLVIQWPILKTINEMQAGKSNKGGNTSYPLIQNLKDYFLQIGQVDEMNPLPIKFTQNEPFSSMSKKIILLGEKLYQALNNVTDMKIWYTNLAMLPVFLSQIFNFQHILYIFDHVDIADINVRPTPPFSKKCSCITLIEYVKLMLSKGFYLISCSDEQHLLESLEPIDEDGYDMRGTSTIESIVDSCTDVSTKYEFDLIVENHDKPIRMKIEDCGGCSGFIAQWQEICAEVDMYNTLVQDGKSKLQAEKRRLKVLILLRALAPRILVLENQRTQEIQELIDTITDYEVITKQSTGNEEQN